MITMIDYNKAFQLFVGADENKPDFMTPFKQNGNYFATDTMAMIYMPVEEIELNYPEKDRPKCSLIIPEEQTMNIKLSVTHLEQKLIPEMIEEFTEEVKEIKCDECSGNGEVEFEYATYSEIYYHDADCPVCEGVGLTEKIEKTPTGKTIPNPYKNYKMLGTIFSYWQLKRLLDACKILQINTIIKTNGTKIKDVKIKGDVFKCGKTSIMIMPIITDNVPEEEITIII